MAHSQLYITLAVLFGFFMAWGVGANDVANAMGTSVGSRALTVFQAIIIAAIFEVLGSLLAGGQVTNTIRGQMIDPSLFVHHPYLLVDGMLASLLAAGTWLLVATRFGWPVSTTHSIVGAVIGFSVISFGSQSVHWVVIINIFLSWIVTPIISAVLAFLLFRSVQRLIFNSATPVRSAKRYAPVYMFLVVFVLVEVTLLSGLKHIGLHLTVWNSVAYACVISLGCAMIGRGMIADITSRSDDAGQRIHFQKIEKIFSILMVFTACAMAFAHGSNDVANAIGPLAAVVSIVTTGVVTASSPLPFWILCVGAVGIVSGLMMYGYRVIATVGSHITALTPSRGFAAQLATASTVVIASGMGLPISTTQTLVGGVLGVGLARGIAALNLSVIRNIFVSWIITLPAGAVFSIIYYHLLRWLLPG